MFRIYTLILCVLLVWTVLKTMTSVFVEDDWEKPNTWCLRVLAEKSGLNGMEANTGLLLPASWWFECRPFLLKPTYGLERLAMYPGSGFRLRSYGRDGDDGSGVFTF